ncbi:hypothetical protein LCGC14_1570760 [marine sediment metagenome]|uniref:Uncharacterized protein n=1 Tax=marine sediment metagenome TaxID=412755 RepID=A0A0F9IJV5_9ZZZZ
MMQRTFFMRFYGKTEAEINECIDEMKLQTVKHCIVGSEVSCNMVIVDKYRPVRDLIFFPHTKYEMKRIQNAKNQAIYHKWSTPDPQNSELVKREAGESAFGVSQC